MTERFLGVTKIVLQKNNYLNRYNDYRNSIIITQNERTVKCVFVKFGNKNKIDNRTEQDKFRFKKDKGKRVMVFD